MVFVGLLLAFWVALTTIATFRNRVAGTGGGQELSRRLKSQSSAYYGMLLAHFGIAVFILGVTVSKGYELESDVKMNVGDTTQLGGYTFSLKALEDVTGPNYTAARAVVNVTQGGSAVATLTPEKRIYTVRNMPLTDAAIDARPMRHLYVSMGEQLSPQSWIIHIQYKPMVGWIWAGCVLMALGGFLALIDRRYRVTKRTRQSSAIIEGAAP